MNDSSFEIGEYRDELHAEVQEDLRTGEYGYKYRVLDGVMMPPYITPSRYRLSRTLVTRADDICYTSFPKSGSTWLAYILILIVNDGQVPSNTTLRNCVHWVASSWTYPRDAEVLQKLPSPRIFKSHMPYAMALGGEPARNSCRYVYIARNPKDVAVSYYHFEHGKSWSGGYNGPWEHWLQSFLAGRVQRGDWFDHVLGWWRMRRASNIYFLQYENLLRNFRAEVAGLARFLGYSPSPRMLDAIQAQTNFAAMSQTGFSNMHEIKEFSEYFRKGTIGSWKNQFTPAQSEAFDIVSEKKLADSALVFDFE